MIVTAEAIVLKKMRYGDSSLIATIFTREHGKVKILAKGGLRPKSKFAATLMPLSHISIAYYEKKNKLSTASDAENLTPFYEITSSYEHLTVGLLLVEAIDLKQQEEGPDPRLFSMMLRCIQLLDELRVNPRNYFILFQFHFATLQGYKINLKYLPEEDFDIEGNGSLLGFYHEEGMARHWGRTGSINSFTFRIETFYIFRRLIAAGFEECHSIMLENDVFEELTRFFISYFSYHLEQKVEYNSLSLINR